MFRRNLLLAMLTLPMSVAPHLTGCALEDEVSFGESSDNDEGDEAATAAHEDSAPASDAFDISADESASLASPYNANSPAGMNLSKVNAWSSAVPFVNQMKQMTPFISGSSTKWDDGRTLSLDANGWVRSLKWGQTANTTVYSYAPGTPMIWKRLIVRYQGKGTILYQGGVTRNASLSSPGRDVLDVKPWIPSLNIKITATDPTNYVRNIAVVPEGGVCSSGDLIECRVDADCPGTSKCSLYEHTYDSDLFHPEFLRRSRIYRTLRFMDWMNTNHTQQQYWSQRPRLTHATWAKDGVPVEVMVELANELGVDPWFNMPHLSSDDYVRQFAIYVRDNLDPSLKAYVEHSNEVWNGVFPQATYARNRGLAAGLSTNAQEAKLRWHSRRSVQIFSIWTTVFGGTSRLVRVMGSQASSHGVSQKLLDYNGAYKQTDALAIAPYFGGYLGTSAWASKVRAMSLSALLTEIDTKAVPLSIQWMASSSNVAKQRGVDLIAYEGGQHLVGVGSLTEDAKINALMDSANRSAAMKTIYLKYLAGWRKHGKLFLHFSDCQTSNKWGRWGSLEYSRQPRAQAPKYDALLRFIETTPRWW